MAHFPNWLHYSGLGLVYCIDVSKLQNIVPPKDTIIADMENVPPFTWISFCKKRCTQTVDNAACVYPHDDGGRTTSPLVHALPTIRSDLGALAKKVSQSSDIKSWDDVAIHIRIGDIARQDHRLYGLVPYESYASLIPRTAKSIGIITAPFKQERSGWGPGDVELNKGIVLATRDYIQRRFPNATVSIRNDPSEGMDVAYTRMILAKRAICGPSTFCLFPALACHGKSFIFHSPLFGDEDSWLSTVAKNNQNIHYVKKHYIPSFKEVYDKKTFLIFWSCWPRITLKRKRDTKEKKSYKHCSLSE